MSKSLNRARGDSKRFPSRRLAAWRAFAVVALGTLTSNGKALSAATRTSNMRTASDTDIPMAASVFAAFFFTFSSTRMWTIVVAMRRTSEIHCISIGWFRFGFLWVEVENTAIFSCLLYTSDAADEEDSVDLGG